MRIKKKKKKKKAFHLASSDQMLIPWQTKMYHTRQQPLFWIRSRGEGKRVGSFAEQRLLGPRLTKMVGYRKTRDFPNIKLFTLWVSDDRPFVATVIKKIFFFYEKPESHLLLQVHTCTEVWPLYTTKVIRAGLEILIVKRHSYNEIWSNITFIVDAMQHRSYIIDVRSKLLR